MIKIQWDESGVEGTAQLLIYFIVPGFLASMSTVAFAIAAFAILHPQKSGLYNNPASPAGLGTLVSDSNLLKKFQSLRSFETQEGIDNTLGDLQSSLKHVGASYQITLLDANQSIPEIPEKKWRRDSNKAHPWWLRGSTYTGLNILMIIPFVILYVIIFHQAYAAVLENDALKIKGDAFSVKICSSIVALANAALYANWHLNVAILQPYHKLSECSQKNLCGSSSALRMDFTGSAIYNLMRPGQSFDVWLMAVCAFLTQLTVIIRPAVLQNLSFIAALGWKDSTNWILRRLFESVSIPAGVAPLRIISYVFDGIYLILTLFGLLLIMTSRRSRFLTRKPYTLSSQILYLCHGTQHLEDLKGMSTLSKKARDIRLKQNGHKYALGLVEDGATTCSYVGIDRLENVARRFKYPKEDPIELRRQHMSRVTFERLHPGFDECKTRRDAGWPDNGR